MSEKGKPSIVKEDNLNLSVAWARAFLESIAPRREDLVPLVIMVNDFENGTVKEDSEIRQLLDTTLQGMGKQSCNTVANTIFPQSLWNPNADRRELYERYLRILPAIEKCPKNRYGVYFERMIDFAENRKGKQNERDDSRKRSNQLEHIIKAWERGNRRRSVLQAAIFDPRRDHTNQRRRGFPCLQHVTFAHYGDGRRLAINGFYATQYLFERAYGNYLGLCRLGKFIAHELGLELVQMNCTVGIATPDVPNESVGELADELRRRLDELEHY